MPAEWYRDQDDKSGVPGRQQLVIYKWVTSTETWKSNKFEIAYNQRFEARPDSPTFELPEDVWVAPLEAVQVEDNDAIKRLLEGYIGPVVEDWYQVCEGDTSGDLPDDFFFADDFLIIFDTDGNLISGPLPTRQVTDWSVYAVHGLDLHDTGDIQMTADDEPMKRYASSGVVLYGREGLTSIGIDDSVDPQDRQRYLQDKGESHFVHPRSGALVRATR